MLKKVTDANFEILCFNNHSGNLCECVTYLGIIIDDILDFRYHINAIRDKVTKGAGMLTVCSSFMPNDCLLLIYNAFVLPYYLYCKELWSNACTTFLQLLRILQKMYSFKMPCFSFRTL